MISEPRDTFTGSSGNAFVIVDYIARYKVVSG